MMRILVVGNGAREDALSWRLSQSASCSALFAAPGNAGTASRGVNWDIAATDGKALVERALAEKIDLVVLGPEVAIAAGVGDRLRDAGIPAFGPNRSSGRLESSKVFSKRFMEARRGRRRESRRTCGGERRRRMRRCSIRACDRCGVVRKE
jgi:phosphoribosylamine--glycine ligase